MLLFSLTLSNDLQGSSNNVARWPVEVHFFDILNEMSSPRHHLTVSASKRSFTVFGEDKSCGQVFLAMSQTAEAEIIQFISREKRQYQKERTHWRKDNWTNTFVFFSLGGKQRCQAILLPGKLRLRINVKKDKMRETIDRSKIFVQWRVELPPISRFSPQRIETLFECSQVKSTNASCKRIHRPEEIFASDSKPTTKHPISGRSYPKSEVNPLILTKNRLVLVWPLFTLNNILGSERGRVSRAPFSTFHHLCLVVKNSQSVFVNSIKRRTELSWAHPTFFGQVRSNQTWRKQSTEASLDA